MRRFFLVAVCILLSALFSLYILDIRPEDNHALLNYTEDLQCDAEIDKVVYISAEPVQTASFEPVIHKGHRASGEGDWELVWEDDFSGPYLNPKYWTAVERRDNYNNELQYFTPDNAYLEDGCLYLTAKREYRDGKRYTSGMVQTKHRLSFLYGKIEAKMKMPVGRGLFPAFWLLTYSGDHEIDIMEMVGCQPNTIYGVNHYLSKHRRSKTFNKIVVDRPDHFNLYTLEWEPGELRFYVNETLFHRTGTGIPTEDMYIIFTLAVGGDWPGHPDESTVFPCSFVVDYIRIFQKTTEETEVCLY